MLIDHAQPAGTADSSALREPRRVRNKMPKGSSLAGDFCGPMGRAMTLPSSATVIAQQYRAFSIVATAAASSRSTDVDPPSIAALLGMPHLQRMRTAL